MIKSLLMALIAASLLSAQVNTWSRGDNSGAAAPGCKHLSALVYSADSNRFLSTMGWVFNGNWNPVSRYSELGMRLPDTRWINLFPHDSCYGPWGDSTGNVTGLGANVSAVFSVIGGYLRPGLFHSAFRSFYQYAYDSDAHCIYYYMANRTLRYSTRTRRWDSLAVPVHPASVENGTSHLIWGSLAYDPINKEIVLFGGANADVRNGHCGTWVLSTATGTWNRLTTAVQPPPRSYSQMVYDSKNRCIILFGGDHLDYLLADTWVYDCESRTWSEKAPALSPSPRASHAMLFLPKSQTVVLLGGYNYNPGYKQIAPMEMWRYDVSADEWSLIKTFSTTDVRPNWLFQSITASDTGDRIVAFGDSSAYGGFYKLTFTMDCDPTQTDAAGTISLGVAAGTLLKRPNASDPAWFSTGISVPNGDSIEDIYSSLPPNTWVTMKPPKNPNATRDWSTITFVPELDQVLIWGGGHSAYSGTDVAHYTLGTDRWSIGYAPEFLLNFEGDGGNSGYNPQYFTYNNRPFMPGHTRRGYCYSSLHKKMVAHNYGTKYTYLYDPFKMDYDTLRILRPAAMPGGTTGYCVINTSHGVFMWPSGGTFCLLDSSITWKTLPVKDGSKAPSYYDLDAGGDYDTRHNRVLMVSKNALLGQVWAYDFDDSTLTALNPTGTYNAVNSFWRDPSYLPGPDMLFVQGDSSSSLYDCATNTWAILPAVRSAGMRNISGSNAAGTFEPNRNLVISMNTSWQGLQVNVMRVAPDSQQSGLSGNDDNCPAGQSVSSSPNPFNPVTTIVPPYSGAHLSIHDISGKCVADFGTVAEGRVLWNASGRPSGVYIVKAVNGVKTSVKRITLLR